MKQNVENFTFTGLRVPRWGKMGWPISPPPPPTHQEQHSHSRTTLHNSRREMDMDVHVILCLRTCTYRYVYLISKICVLLTHIFLEMCIAVG